MKSLGRLTDGLKQDPIFGAVINKSEEIEELRRASFQAILDGRHDEASAMIAIIYRHDMMVLLDALKEAGELEENDGHQQVKKD